jgi:hypothetical protein
VSDWWTARTPTQSDERYPVNLATELTIKESQKKFAAHEDEIAAGLSPASD